MVGWVFLVLTGACQFGHGVGGFTADFIYSEALKVIGLDRKKSIIRLVMSAAPTHNHAKSQKTFLHNLFLIVIDAP